jgi:iron-sulfur cluster assembly protein
MRRAIERAIASASTAARTRGTRGMCAADAARTARATREGTSTTTTTATATTATTAVEARKGKRQAMEVTPEASRRIKALLDARQKEYLKIGVKTRGCNGMTYTMNYADESERKKFDELVTTEDGVKIIVEPNALMSIIGTKMDYVSDRLRSEFVFENPNSKAQCGCGESFTV